MKKAVSLLLICAMLTAILSSCGMMGGIPFGGGFGYGFEEGFEEPSGGSISPFGNWEWEPEEDGEGEENGWEAADSFVSPDPEFCPEGVGDSAPLSIDPIPGFHLEAPANALYQDTAFSVSEITEDRYGLTELEKAFSENGELMLGAWEIDAGLSDGEHFPGEYAVSLDLSRLEIDPELYPVIKAYRIADDGTITEYSSSVSGSILTYSTDQNSILVTTAVTLGIGLVGSYLYEHGKQNWYYWFRPGDKTCHMDFDNEYGEYTIKWSMRDVDLNRAKVTERIAEIEQEYQEKADLLTAQAAEDQPFNAKNILAIFKKNKDKATVLKEALAADQEYQQLLKQLDVPELIEQIRSSIDKAFAYLHNVERVKMPGYRVLFACKRGGGLLGAAVANNFKYAYVMLNVSAADTMLSDTPEGKLKRDDMLLTVTHELFHICQNRYHTKFWTDSDRFDEMTAVVLETDALAWYKENGEITTTPEGTPANYWGLFTLPIDSHDAGSDVLQHQGYTLSHFVFYLRKLFGKNVSAGQIMNTRSYFKKPNTSGPLRNAFGSGSSFSASGSVAALADAASFNAGDMPVLAFDNAWKAFCLENRYKAAETYYVDYNASAYPLLDQVKLKKNEGVHVSLGSKGEFTMGIRGLKLYERKAIPLLAKADQGVAEGHPEAEFVSAEPGVKAVSGGFYMPAPKGEIDVEGMSRKVLEVYGAGKQSRDGLGYTVYSMDSPKAPSLSVKNEALVVKLPDPEGLQKAGVVDGLRLTIEAGNKKTEKLLDRAFFGKELNITLSAVTEAKPGDKFDLSATLEEYVQSTTGEKCYGLPSEKASLNAELPEEEPEEEEDEEETQEEGGGSAQEYSARDFVSEYPVTFRMIPEYLIKIDPDIAIKNDYFARFFAYLMNKHMDKKKFYVDKDGVFGLELGPVSDTITFPTGGYSGPWNQDESDLGTAGDGYVLIEFHLSLKGHIEGYDYDDYEINWGEAVVDTGYCSFRQKYHYLTLMNDKWDVWNTWDLSLNAENIKGKGRIEARSGTDIPGAQSDDENKHLRLRLNLSGTGPTTCHEIQDVLDNSVWEDAEHDWDTHGTEITMGFSFISEERVQD